jgi:glycine/serine hydroxymethyltransferase
MHVIAAKAVAFGEALRPDFKKYIRQVRLNADSLADQLIKGGLDIVTGGTDTHLMLVDLRSKGVTGDRVEKALSRACITTNKNGIPLILRSLRSLQESAWGLRLVLRVALESRSFETSLIGLLR